MCASHCADLQSSVVQTACGQKAVQRTPGRRVKIATEHNRIGRPVREAVEPADLGQ